MDAKPNILVLCTGNSCRSQMAEGYLRAFAGDRFHVHSAGLDPKKEVHPLAIQVMQEGGVDISSQTPTDVQNYLGKLAVRYLIVVCDKANESCPRIFPGMLNRLYWPFDDPASFRGPHAVEGFRRIRDQIKARVEQWFVDSDS